MSNTEKVPELLFHTAQGFYDIALHCARSLNKDDNITGFQRIAPAATNFCFTVELLLKGLILLKTKKSIKRHELKLLFEQLPEAEKVQIELRYLHYQNNDKEKDDLGDFRMSISKVGDKEFKYNHIENPSLQDLLTLHNKGFENWRYLYEINLDEYYRVIDFKSLNCFIKAIIDTINSIDTPKKFHVTRARPKDK